jgi:hypothetical protein
MPRTTSSLSIGQWIGDRFDIFYHRGSIDKLAGETFPQAVAQWRQMATTVGYGALKDDFFESG